MQSFYETCLAYNPAGYEGLVNKVNAKLHYSSHPKDIQSHIAFLFSF